MINLPAEGTGGLKGGLKLGDARDAPDNMLLLQEAKSL